MDRNLYLCAVLAVSTLSAPHVSRAATRSCTEEDKRRSVELLRKEHPQGFSVYSGDPAMYLDDAWWSSCEDGPNIDNIVVALHETVHHLSDAKEGSGTGQYPLIRPGSLPYLPEHGFSPPYRAASAFPKDNFVELYMTHRPDERNSAADFSILLDELNAYTHGLHAANVLRHHPVAARQWRAGAVAMMSFVMAYVNRAETEAGRDPSWSSLGRPAVKETLRLLYQQAEEAVEESCPMESDGQDSHYIAYLCGNSGRGLARLLDRKEQCFSRCRIGAGGEDSGAASD